MSEKTHFWSNVRSFEVLVLKNTVISILQLNNVERNGNLRQKIFSRAYVKVFILRKKTHESTQMVPEGPQKFFYRLLALCTDFQGPSWGGTDLSPPKDLKCQNSTLNPGVNELINKNFSPLTSNVTRSAQRDRSLTFVPLLNAPGSRLSSKLRVSAARQT